MENPVRETTLYVVKNAKEVKINRKKIKELAEKWAEQGIKIPDWPFEYHLKTNNPEKMLDYLILLDSLNFCFWSLNPEKKWRIEYKGKEYNGYFALSLIFKKFFEENSKKANLKYFSEISQKEFIKIFQGGKDIQFLNERWKIARRVSKKIIKKYRNSENFVKSAKNKAEILINKIYKELSYFDDISIYKGKKIYFLKRAQILISDIWGVFDGKGIGHFKDMGYLTCFADYKIPQILNNFGILEYSENLKEKIKNRKIIKKGSLEEIEIRASGIWAVEYLREELAKQGIELKSFEVDWILWNKAQSLKLKNPYHITPTIFY